MGKPCVALTAFLAEEWIVSAWKQADCYINQDHKGVLLRGEYRESNFQGHW